MSLLMTICDNDHANIDLLVLASFTPPAGQLALNWYQMLWQLLGAVIVECRC